MGTNVSDVLSGGSGRDRLDEGVSAGTLSGGPGRDVLNGGGGKDVVDAVDGQRDAVTCGTNRGRTTPERDTGLLDSVDIGGEDCELLYRNGKLVLGRGPAVHDHHLEGGNKTGRPEVDALRCRPAGGTLPDPARACASLVGARNAFAPVPPGALCAFTVAGRTARGSTLRGRPFTADFGRWSTCERERWNRHAFLFPASQ